MPLYLYKCNSCEREEEKFRRVIDRKKTFPCSVIGHKIYSVNSGELRQEDNSKCLGMMEFVEIPKSIAIRPNGIEKE